MLNVKFHKFPFKRSHNDAGKEGNSIVTFVITLSLDAVIDMLKVSGVSKANSINLSFS